MVFGEMMRHKYIVSNISEEFYGENTELDSNEAHLLDSCTFLVSELFFLET